MFSYIFVYFVGKMHNLQYNYLLHINVPKIAPMSWLMKYTGNFFFSTWPAKYKPIVAAGFTCPPVNKPAMEIAKKLKQLTKNIQKWLGICLDIGWMYYVTQIPYAKIREPKV